MIWRSRSIRKRLQQPEEKAVSIRSDSYLRLAEERAGCSAEYEILSQMLLGVSAVDLFKEELGFFKDDDSNKLAMYIIDYYRTHDILSVSELYDQIAEGRVRDLLLSVAQWELAAPGVEHGSPAGGHRQGEGMHSGG